MRVAIALVVSLAAGTAGAQEPPRTSTGASAGTRTSALTVSYRSQTAVYVAAGRAAGLAVGDRLALLSGDEKLAELEVVFLAEHSSSCKVVAETRPVKPGDRLVRLGAPRPPAPPAEPEITVAPASGPASEPYVSARPDSAPRSRVTGGASVGYGTFQDSSGSGRDVQEGLARADASGRNLGGLPLHARLRVSGRQVDREGLRDPSLPPTDSRRRLYEASLAWTPPGGRFSAAAGRLGANSFGAFGYLDGVLGQVRPASSVQVGAFVGRTPDALDVGLPSGLKYGGFVRLGGQAASPGELVFAGVREFAGSEVSREYIGQQAQLRSGKLWLYERVEVDLNRGWRRDRSDQGADLSEARVLVSWRASPVSSLSVSYDRSRNYWSALTRPLPSEGFDRRARQTLRADMALTRAGGLGAWLGGSARTEEGADEASYAAYAGVSSPRLASLSLSFEGSYFDTPATRGALATVRAGRGLRGGHRLDFSYTANRYLRGGGDWRMSQWVRASGYAQMLGRAFGRADVEYALQDEAPGLRALVELGYRF